MKVLDGENQRIDFYEYDRLDNALNLDKMPYETSMFLVLSYIKKLSLDESILSSLGINNKYLDLVMESINTITEITTIEDENKINELEKVKIWKEHDAIKEQSSKDKKFLRLAVCCFYDKSFALRDSMHYNAEDTFDITYTLLYELEPKLCRLFTEYILSVEDIK